MKMVSSPQAVQNGWHIKCNRKRSAAAAVSDVHYVRWGNRKAEETA